MGTPVSRSASLSTLRQEHSASRAGVELSDGGERDTADLAGEGQPLWQHDFRLGTPPATKSARFQLAPGTAAAEWAWVQPRTVGETALELTRDAAILLDIDPAHGATQYALEHFTLTLDVQLLLKEGGDEAPFVLLAGQGQPVVAVQAAAQREDGREAQIHRGQTSIMPCLKWMRWHRVVLVFDKSERQPGKFMCTKYVDGLLHSEHVADVSQMWVRSSAQSKDEMPRSLKLFGGGRGGTGSAVAMAPQLRLAYASLIPRALDAATVRAHGHRSWAFDADAADRMLGLTKAEQQDLQLRACMGSSALPLWHSPPFLAEFADPFLARSGLDSSIDCDKSLGVLVRALELLQGMSVHGLDRELDSKQLETLKFATQMFSQAQPLWAQYSESIVAFLKDFNTGVHQIDHIVDKVLRALHEFIHSGLPMLLLPCGWRNSCRDKSWYFVTLILEPEEEPSPGCPSRSFRLTVCNPGGEAVEYHGARVDPPKVKHRGSVSMMGVRAERLCDEAFWTMLYGMTGQFADRCRKSGGNMLYEVLLPWLLEQPTDVSIASTLQKEKDAFSDWITPMYSSTSHYRSLLEGLRYMLRRGVNGGRRRATLAKRQVKFITFSLRATFLQMVKADLRVVRAITSYDRALIDISTQQLALASVKAADAKHLPMEELRSVHALVESIGSTMSDKPQLRSSEAFMPLSLNNMELGRTSMTLFPYFDRVCFKDVRGLEGVPLPVPKELGVDMLGLTERAITSEALARALHLTEELCLQLSSLDAAGAVRHSSFLKFSLMQHVFTYVIPVPRPSDATRLRRPQAWDFGPSLRFGQQLELLLLLQRLAEHFAAAAFSLKASKALDGVCVATPRPAPLVCTMSALCCLRH